MKLANGGDAIDPFAHGTEVYVRLDILDPNTQWIKARITRFLADSDQVLVEGNFAINDEGSIVPSTETECISVSRRNLAFASQPSRILPVRTHVLVALTSGIIAEKPRKENGHRYLIFFECGSCGYFDPSDVQEAADGLFDLDNCDVTLPIYYKLFLQDYFTRYPMRIPIEHKVGNSIDFNVGTYDHPIWSSATVTKIDASCITVSSSSTKQRNTYSTQIIYKASPKIKRIYNIISFYINKFGGHMHSLVPLQNEPKDEPKPKEAKSFTLSIPRSRRILRNVPTQKSNNCQASQAKSMEFPIKGDKFFSITRPSTEPFKTNVIKRRHHCNSTCIQNKTDLRALRGLNCFSLPEYFGFRRFEPLDGSIYYKSPCGLTLSSLTEIGDYLIRTNCVLDIDSFTFEMIDLSDEIYNSPLQCVTYQLDISNGNEVQPVSLINCYNEIKLNTDFVYDSKRSLAPEIAICVDEPFLSCCDCKDNCSDPNTCSCIKLIMISNFSRKGSSFGDESPHTYSFKRLNRPNKFGIYECNSRCPCSKYCPNRVVQNGIKCSLQVFMTRPDLNKGWGVRTLFDIPKGTFICTYSGKVMRDESVSELDFYSASLDFIECAEEHKEGYEQSVPDELMCDNESGFSSSSSTVSSSEQSTSRIHQTLSLAKSELVGSSGYSFRPRAVKEPSNLSKKCPKQKSVREFLQLREPYVVASQKTGNIGRFLNHSCEPNLFTQNVFIDTHDLRLPHVALFANRTIRAMEELTWDYSYEIGCIPGRQITCNCGSGSCRGRLL